MGFSGMKIPFRKKSVHPRISFSFGQFCHFRTYKKTGASEFQSLRSALCDLSEIFLYSLVRLLLFAFLAFEHLYFPEGRTHLPVRFAQRFKGADLLVYIKESGFWLIVFFLI